MLGVGGSENWWKQFRTRSTDKNNTSFGSTSIFLQPPQLIESDNLLTLTLKQHKHINNDLSRLRDDKSDLGIFYIMQWHENTIRAQKAEREWQVTQFQYNETRTAVTELVINAINTIIEIVSPPPTLPRRLSTDVLLRFFFSLSTPLRLPPNSHHEPPHEMSFLFIFFSLPSAFAYARAENCLCLLFVCACSTRG